MPDTKLQQSTHDHAGIVVNRQEEQNRQDTVARQSQQRPPEAIKKEQQPAEPMLYLPEISELTKGFGDRFEEKLSFRMRVLEQREGKTELNQKRLTRENIKRRRKSEAQFRSENMVKLMKNRKTACSKDTWNDLSWFVGTADEHRNKMLLDLYLGTKSKNSGEVVGQDVQKALIIMSNMITAFDLSEIDLKNDSQMALSTEKLEQMSGMIGAFDRLVKKSPDFLEEIPERERAGLEAKCEQMRLMAAYYSVRKDVIFNDQYAKYRNEELSLDIENDNKIQEDEEEKERDELSGKVILSWALGRRILKMNGKDVPDGELPLKNAASREYLLEAEKMTEGERLKELVEQEYQKTDALIAQYRKKAEAEAAKQPAFKVEAPQKGFMQDVVIIEEERQEEGQKENVYDTLFKQLTEEDLKASLGDDKEDIAAVGAVRKSVQALQAFLELKMPEIPVKAEKSGQLTLDRTAEEAFREEIDNTCVMSTMLFKRLVDSLGACGDRFAEKNPQLRDMLMQMKEQCTKDSELFRQKVFEYREFAVSDKTLGKKRLKESTWRDALAYTRAQFYDLDDVNKFKVKLTGAGASLLRVIKRKVPKSEKNPEGVETIYFRKEDKVPVTDNDLVMQEVLAESSFDEKDKEAIRKIMSKVIGDFGTSQKLSSQLQALKGKNESMEKIGRYFTARIPKMMERYGTADKETMKKLGQVYLDAIGAWSQRAIASNINNFTPMIERGRSLSCRNVATSRLATMLGLEALVCDSRTAVIKADGKLIRGNVMEETGGKEINDCSSGTRYSDKAIVQHYVLQVFDLICGQVDRHNANYHVIVKDGQVTNIRGLDNDMAFGRLRFSDVAKGRNRMKPLTGRAILAMPASVVTRIMTMTPEYLYQTLGDILNGRELAFLWDRFKGVQQEIRQLHEKNEDLGAKWENGKLVFDHKEDADLRLRALKMLKLEKEELAKKNRNRGWDKINNYTLFVPELLEGDDIDKRIKNRRSELGKKKR